MIDLRGDFMEIKQIIDDILQINKDIQINYQDYVYDNDYSSVIDNQLNAKSKMLQTYLKNNGFIEYYGLLDQLIPIENNAVEYFEIFISMKDDILEFDRYNNLQIKIKLIETLAICMQKKYNINEINYIFNSFGIKYGDEYCAFDNKRIYIRNILQSTTMLQIIRLAKSENVLTKLIKVDELSELNNSFIEEQIEKCNMKIEYGDYDGAITNARSLLEEVLLEIEKKIDGCATEYDGKIVKLYKRVRKKMNLDSSDVDNYLKDICTGLASVINGLASLSNNSSDRHARKFKPDKRHAIFCVDSSFIMCRFLYDSYKFQFKK